jgi:hypothetical protein
VLSSIFSSSWSANKALAVLLTLLALYFATLELASRTVITKTSASLNREQADYAAMLKIRPTGKSGKPSMLIIGNSLLLHGVDRPVLVEATASRFDVSLFPIEGTSYYDWYFGMRRYFDENARPAVVVLCMNARQIASDATNTEHFPHAMMRIQDLPDVVKASRLDTMTASNYVFTHWSMWLATRANVRNGLMERLMPRSVELVPHFTVRGDAALGADERTADRVLVRLQEFQSFARANGAEFIWAVPPTEFLEDAAPLVSERAREAGVSVVIPFKPGEMPDSAYSDGFHLNPQGATAFTGRLAPALRDVELPGMTAATPR